MKTHKYYLVFFFTLLFSLYSFDASAFNCSEKTSGLLNNNNGTQQSSNTIGAPLDGGILALLFGAGVAYFARKKKRSI